MNDPTNGVAAPVIPINPGVAVTNGLFTTGMDFGAANFDGTNLWLEISVRTNGGGVFATLSPRQLLASAPYAIRALNAVNATTAALATNVSGSVSDAQLSANVARLDTVQTFTGAKTFGNLTVSTHAGLGGPISSAPVAAYDSSGLVALQTGPNGIVLGDVNAGASGNTFKIDFESASAFTFSGANVAINGGSLSLAGGNVQIPAANDYKYATAKTRYYSVSAVAFELENSSVCSRGTISGDIYTVGGSAVSVAFFQAPVNLPDGATVTSLTFYVVDNDGTYNLQAGQLWRNDASTSTSYGNSFTMATTPLPASSNSTLIQATTTSSISFPVINNQNCTYWLRWGTQQSNANLRLVKVLIRTR